MVIFLIIVCLNLSYPVQLLAMCLENVQTLFFDGEQKVLDCFMEQSFKVVICCIDQTSLCMLSKSFYI